MSGPQIVYQGVGGEMTRQGSKEARQALWEIVRECVRGQGLEGTLTEDQAVAASVELIDNGFAHIECEDGCWYRLVAKEAGEAGDAV